MVYLTPTSRPGGHEGRKGKSMTAKIVWMGQGTLFGPATEQTSIYTDRWARTIDELISSYKNYNSAEILYVEIISE